MFKLNANVVIIIVFLLFLALAFLSHYFFSLQGIIPIINWERSSFSTPSLALLVFLTVSLFPTICLPSTPSMWVAGMTFGYGFGFLLIMPAVIIGVSLPYLVGSLFRRKIQVSIYCIVGYFLHIMFNILSKVCILSFVLNACYPQTGLDGNVPKESFSHKISW